MEFRHEEKFEINFSDMLTVRQRMRCVAYPDPHAVNGVYRIRSLYFDSASDKALREKLDGVSRREKFRIRCYNGDSSVIHLEKKSKLGGLGNKQTAPLTAEQTQRIIDGDIAWMADSEWPLIQELHAKMFSEGLLPRTIVDYTREPFVYPAGNVRMCDDPDVRDPIKFLRAREIVHYQRFGEALRLTTDRLDERNFYAFNPAFDK